MNGSEPTSFSGFVEDEYNNNIGSIGQFYDFSCPGVVNGNVDCKEAILLFFFFSQEHTVHSFLMLFCRHRL